MLLNGKRQKLNVTIDLHENVAFVLSILHRNCLNEVQETGIIIQLHS